MPTCDQLIELIKAHKEDNPEKFEGICGEIISSERNKNRWSNADRIQDAINIDSANRKRLYALPKDIKDLVIDDRSIISIDEMVGNSDYLKAVIEEYKNKDILKEYGLNCTRKILLAGPPGTGKTMSVKILANELKLPLYIFNMAALINSFLGDTGKNLARIFQAMKTNKGIYFLDEIDSIALARKKSRDSVEINRVLNLLFQYLDSLKSQIIFIAATNLFEFIDSALIRRFDTLVHFEYVQPGEFQQLVEVALGDKFVLDTQFEHNHKHYTVNNNKVRHSDVVNVIENIKRILILEKLRKNNLNSKEKIVISADFICYSIVSFVEKQLPAEDIKN